MKKSLFSILLVLLAFAVTAADPAVPSAATVKLPTKDKFFLFILAGQSNMAGRGKIAPQDQQVNPRVLTLNKDGQWVPAVDPIHFDKKLAGVGLGRTFGLLAAEKYPEVTIGLIPCACGGSSIKTWVPGGFHQQTHSYPYDDTLKRVKTALAAGTLKGILWHQGEADISMKPEQYTARLLELIARFRTEFNAPDVPVIIGQLGQFKPWGEGTKGINRAHLAAAAGVGNGAFVSSDGLTCNPDNIHFDAVSQREFGRRYFAAWLKVAESSAGKADLKK